MGSLRGLLLVPLVALTVVAGACSSDPSDSSDAADASGVGAPASTPAASPTAQVSATPSADVAGNSSDDNLASRICTALAPATADLQMSSAAPAEAVQQLKQTVAKVYAPGEAALTGADLDARTKQTCPDLRDEVLLTINQKSLAGLARSTAGAAVQPALHS